MRVVITSLMTSKSHNQTFNSLRTQLIEFDNINGEKSKSVSTIFIYKMFMAKEKALYEMLNKMKLQGNNIFTGYFWAADLVVKLQQDLLAI